MESPDLDLFFGEMDAAGISRIGIPGRVPNRWWGGSGNDLVFAACADRPDRLFALAAVDPFDTEAPSSIASLKAAGARAIVLEPGIADPRAYVDDPRCDEVFAASVESELPVLIMGGGEAGPDLSFNDPLRFERVAIRFPALQLVNVHAGWPFVQGILGVAYRRPNVWLMGDVYFPRLPGEGDYVCAMKTYLEGRFLFATGFPYLPMKDTVDEYGRLGLPEPTLEKVMGLNAQRLFGL
jgi:hypothetical protein